MQNFSLAIHGGASTLAKSQLEPDRKQYFEQGLIKATKAGWDILKRNGSAVDAVCAAICILEDTPVFNAGKGSVLCSDQKIRLSASLMCGQKRDAAALMGLTTIKNPIRSVQAMLSKPVVSLFGTEAENFAIEHKCETVNPEYFMTERSLSQWKKLRAGQGNTAVHTFIENPGNTVGAVAMDVDGNLAAGTSTGGLLNQPPGRVSDTAVIGSGTWAENSVCAISATGDGEAFIRTAFARRAADLIELKGLNPEEAVRLTLSEVEKADGFGGCIIIDSKGKVALPFNSAHMARAYAREDGIVHLGILPDEDFTHPL